MFTAVEVMALMNYKVHELEQTAIESVNQIEQALEETTDDRLNAESIEAAKEYLDMIRDEVEFSVFALVLP